MVALTPAFAQGKPGGPPAVGVVKAEKKPITETNEFIGRIEATFRRSTSSPASPPISTRSISSMAPRSRRATCSTSSNGRPFQADLDAKKAVADQYRRPARQRETGGRAGPQSLLQSNAGAQATVDSSHRVAEGALEAQLLGCQARASSNRRSTSTTRASSRPSAASSVAPKSRVATSCRRSSGTLVTIVSQDPMYVTFPVSVRTLLQLAAEIRAGKGGFKAVKIRVKLPDGRVYAQAGELERSSTTRFSRPRIRSSCAARSRTRCSAWRRRRAPVCANCQITNS